MSTLEVNKITPVSGGTTVQVGESGDTINIPAGATIANAGTATGFGVSLANGADNRVVTASSASALNGESTLTFNGTTLQNNQAQNTDATIHASSYTTGVKLIADSQNSLSKIDASGNLAFINASSERMRIGANGTVYIPDSTDSGRIDIVGGSSDPYILMRGPTTGTTTKVMFLVNGSEVGTINTTSSSTQYNTSSDYRLKENEVAISDGIERLKQLKPYKFNFKTEPDTTVDGFFAHEVSSIVPEAISGEKDATETYIDDNGDEQTRINPQGIDQSKLVPLLTKALQEAITKIETLEAKVAALESA